MVRRSPWAGDTWNSKPFAPHSFRIRIAQVKVHRGTLRASDPRESVVFHPQGHVGEQLPAGALSRN